MLVNTILLFYSKVGILRKNESFLPSGLFFSYILRFPASGKQFANSESFPKNSQKGFDFL